MSKRNLIDDVVSAGATFDWITPALGLLSGKPVIGVPADDMTDAREKLHDAGINIHYEQIIDGQYVFHVDEADMDVAIAALNGTRKEPDSAGGCFWTALLIAVLLMLAVVFFIPW